GRPCLGPELVEGLRNRTLYGVRLFGLRERLTSVAGGEFHGRTHPQRSRRKADRVELILMIRFRLEEAGAP
ncbi:MAG: hypothetical protein ACLFUF_03865, partial [Opitutales bacterium]